MAAENGTPQSCDRRGRESRWKKIEPLYPKFIFGFFNEQAIYGTSEASERKLQPQRGVCELSRACEVNFDKNLGAFMRGINKVRKNA